MRTSRARCDLERPPFFKHNHRSGIVRKRAACDEHLPRSPSCQRRELHKGYHGNGICKNGLNRPEQGPSRITSDTTRCSLPEQEAARKLYLRGRQRKGQTFKLQPFHGQRWWLTQEGWHHIARSSRQCATSLKLTKICAESRKNRRLPRHKICKIGLGRPERLRPSRTTWDPTRCSLLLHKSCTERTLKGMARSPFDSQRRWPKQDAGAMGKLLSTTWRFSNAHEDLRRIAPRTATTTAARPARKVWNGRNDQTPHGQ